MAKKLEEGDEERVRYLETLKNGYRFRGFVRFDQGQATIPIARHLGLDEKGFIDLMIRYLRTGGRLDRVDENRPEWRELWRFHFDLWPELGANELYVETRFVDDPVLDKREIIVVSVHPPKDVAWSRWNR
jgi:hypothetical protein